MRITKAAADVLAERSSHATREGWDSKGDDSYVRGELSVAAACYAAYGTDYANRCGGWIRSVWPWAMHWFKPWDRRRNLVKAGSLILAEIERLDRASGETANTRLHAVFPMLDETTVALSHDQPTARVSGLAVVVAR